MYYVYFWFIWQGILRQSGKTNWNCDWMPLRVLAWLCRRATHVSDLFKSEHLRGAISLALEVIWKYCCIIYDLDRWSSTSPAYLWLNSLNRNSQQNFTWIKISRFTVTIKKQFTFSFACFLFFWKAFKGLTMKGKIFFLSTGNQLSFGINH